MRNRKRIPSTLPLIPLVLATAGASLHAQWSAEDLDRNTQKFLEPGVLQLLTQCADLVAVGQPAWSSIAKRVHGDHREYLIRIERLVDRLTDERWAERERAERELAEVGAGARTLLQERVKSGELLEERIRCQRILAQIELRGTEKEDQERMRLRGLAAAALYLPKTDSLVAALVSALGHTDSVIATRAIRALGRHGDDAHADALRAMVTRSGSGNREVALDALARLRGTKALGHCRALLLGPADDQTAALNVSERVAMLRTLKQREDAKELLAAVAAAARDGEQANETMLAVAELSAAATPDRAPKVTVTLSDRSEVVGTFRGMAGNAIVLDTPAVAIERLAIPLDWVDHIGSPAADPAKPDPSAATPVPADWCRVFLNQGSLISGRLAGFGNGRLKLTDTRFGDLEIARSEIQGVALDVALDRLIGGSSKFDRLRLRKDKQNEQATARFVDGKLTAIRDGQARIQPTGGGAARSVPLAQIDGFLFERPRQFQSDGTLFTRIDLSAPKGSGLDRLLGHLAAAPDGQLGVVVPGIGGAVFAADRARRIEFEVGGGAMWGFTLIADYADNQILEVDDQGKELLKLPEVYGVWDVECLDSGNLLITEFAISKVKELTRDGKVVWEFDKLRNPYDADRLPNGNTLIADTFGGRVIEVSPNKEIVWQFDVGIRPFDVDRLPNGNTLIADVVGKRVIEVAADKSIVWTKAGLDNVFDADRLPNGNTLITIRAKGQVIEVDRSGTEVFRIEGLNAPSDADRLPNGHTIVAENNAVREFDRSGTEVWSRQVTWAVEVNRY